jgi:glycosyltransferase involved in cell wall biosynthesis
MITIGLPFFNNQATLRDAIRSVFAQTYQDWELLLVDDGSTDSSRSIAAAVHDPRVRLVTHDDNRGLPVRLNEITKLARGEYLARLDGDDMMHPERLAKQLYVLTSKPEVDLVGTAMYSLDTSDQPKGIRGNGQVDLTPINVLSRGLLIHATITGRTNWFIQHPYNESHRRAEDRELYVRTFQTSTFFQIAEPLYFCREEHSVRLAKYLASCRNDRTIFREYGPQMIGSVRTLELCVMSYLKGAIYTICCALGLEHHLVRKRNQSVRKDQMECALATLATIMTTTVPGLTGEVEELCGNAKESQPPLRLEHV